MTKKEHLIWCKKRALEYVEKGELQNAFNSMVSDLGKHSETAVWYDKVGMVLAIDECPDMPRGIREFIEGFN